MDDPAELLSNRNLLDPALMRTRHSTATTAAGHLRAAGDMLADTATTGSDQQAMATLTLIAGELLAAAADGLSGDRHYAGAALLRQVVEVEYLGWAFSTGHRDAQRWATSTRDDRMKYFSPTKIRRLSQERFDTADYELHCNLGGHPVVDEAQLLLHRDNPRRAQVLLVDLLLHSWRSTDALLAWATDTPGSTLPLASLRTAQRVFGRWGQTDPLCRLPPPPR